MNVYKDLKMLSKVKIYTNVPNSVLHKSILNKITHLICLKPLCTFMNETIKLISKTNFTKNDDFSY